MIHVRPFPLRAGRGTFIDHQRNFLVQTEGPWRSLVLCFKSVTDTFAPAQHFRVREDAAGAWCNDASHHLLTVSTKLTQYFLRGVIWQQTGFLVLLDITVWSCAFGCVWIRTSEYLNRYKGVALGDGLLTALVYQIFRLIQPFYSLYTLLYLEFWMGFGSCLCSSFSGWRKTWYQGRGMISHTQPWLTEMPGVLAPMHTSPAVNVTQLQSFCVLSALDINRLQQTKCLWKQWKYKEGIYTGLI